MTSSPEVNCDLTLPATIAAAEEFFGEFRRRACSVLGRSQRFVAELLVREALNNAVLHGCNGDPDRMVGCRLKLNDRRLFIAVLDDGCGFDWRETMGSFPDPIATSGRGIELLAHYSSRFRFNKRGNRVAIYVRFRGEKQ